MYIIKPFSGKGPMCMVNQWQLFDLHKSQGNDMPSSLAPDTQLPTMLMKKPTKNVIPQQSHPYGTRSQTKETSEDGRSFGVVGKLFNWLATRFQQ